MNTSTPLFHVDIEGAAALALIDKIRVGFKQVGLNGTESLLQSADWKGEEDALKTIFKTHTDIHVIMKDGTTATFTRREGIPISTALMHPVLAWQFRKGNK